MTETKIIHLNQNYSLRVDFDLETLETQFIAVSRVTNEVISSHCNSLSEVIDEYGNCENDIELLDDTIEIGIIVRDWIHELDIEELTRINAESEAEERAADTREDMERNG